MTLKDCPRLHTRQVAHQAGANPEKRMESKVILLSSYVTGVLHTARISTVEVIMSSNK